MIARFLPTRVYRPCVGHSPVLLLALAILVGSAPSAAEACATMQSRGVPRVVLAFYDGTREPDPRSTRIHRYVELPLNHMGYRLAYHDVASDTSDVAETELARMGEAIAATLSWFDAPVPDPAKLAALIDRLEGGCDTGLRVVAFGHPGFPLGSTPIAERDRYLGRLGLVLAGSEVVLGAHAPTPEVDDQLIGYETDFLIIPGTYPPLAAASESRSHLRIPIADDHIDLVVTAERGAYVHDSAAIQGDPRGGAFWVLDPFGLFERVLGSAPWPVPDSTTLNGRRMYFSTIESEGWLSMLPARQFGDLQPLASEIVADRFIAPYPDLPVSVGILTGDLDPALAGSASERGRAAAERILAHPHVQPATTGKSLVQDWDFFAAYDPDREARALRAGRAAWHEKTSLITSAVQTLEDAFDSSRTALDLNPGAPRKYAQTPFDLSAEISGALTDIAALAPSSSPPPMFLWSGNARPFPAALDAVRDAKASAIGGGGGLYQASAPSITNLWPLAAQTRGGLQVYDALSGDDSYTHYWTKTLFRFHSLKQTLDWTNAPRRLKPFQLSYSARSAVHFETRRAIEAHLEIARSDAVIPVTAARYSRIVEGFFSYRALSDGEGAWRILDRGALQTVRFDAAEDLALDIALSRGVLGARREGPALFVALDPQHPAPRVALAKSSDESGVVLDAPAPALSESRLDVLALRRDACVTRATVTGFAEGEMAWTGMANETYDVVLYAPGSDDQRLFWTQVTADGTGRFAITLPLPPRQTADVSLSAQCARG